VQHFVTFRLLKQFADPSRSGTRDRAEADERDDRALISAFSSIPIEMTAM